MLSAGTMQPNEQLLVQILAGQRNKAQRNFLYGRVCSANVMKHIDVLDNVQIFVVDIEVEATYLQQHDPELSVVLNSVHNIEAEYPSARARQKVLYVGRMSYPTKSPSSTESLA